MNWALLATWNSTLIFKLLIKTFSKTSFSFVASIDCSTKDYPENSSIDTWDAYLDDGTPLTQEWVKNYISRLNTDYTRAYNLTQEIENLAKVSVAEISLFIKLKYWAD